MKPGNKSTCVAAVMLHALMLAGCGDRGDVPTVAIKNSHRPLQSVILGTWDGRLVLDDNAPAEIDEVARQVAESSEFRFEYQDSGVIRLSVRSQIPGQGAHAREIQGKWKLVEENGDQIKLKVKYQGNTEESIRLHVIDQDTIETAAPDELNGFTLRMTRVGK